MAKYTIEALADMETIYNHITYVLQAPENALRLYNNIAERLKRLKFY